MKSTKRFVALLMAVVMTFALGAVALAENGVLVPTNEEPYNTFEIKKVIYVSNNTPGDYMRPQVKYDYEITSDVGPYKAHLAGIPLMPGLAGGLKGKEVGNADEGTHHETAGTSFSLFFHKQVVTDVASKDNATEPIKASIEPITFAIDLAPYRALTGDDMKPGVYRYKVTDTTPSAYLNSVGVVRPTDYDPVCYIDLYIEFNQTGPSVSSIVVSEKGTVPKREENGTIIGVNPDDESDTHTYDPKEIYVTEDGTIYTRDSADSKPSQFPDGYTKTDYKATMETGLYKTEDVYNESPVNDFTDSDVKDGKPDVDENKVPTNKTGTEPYIDDKGNVVTTGGETIEKPYQIKDDGKIWTDTDGDGTFETDTGKYAQYRGTFTFKSDSYTCYNIALKKDVSGDMGDKTHEFPFIITVNNNTADSPAQTLEYSYVNDLGAETKNVTTTTIDAKLKHDDVYIIRGLNPHATVNFKETNDTSFPYQVNIMSAEGLVGSTRSMESTQSVTAYEPTARTVADFNSNDNVFEEKVGVVTFYNVQSSINPTGVVLRFAPYILMLGAAFFFVALSHRRREQENA
jgi:hypothetical protein